MTESDQFHNALANAHADSPCLRCGHSTLHLMTHHPSNTPIPGPDLFKVYLVVEPHPPRKAWEALVPVECGVVVCPKCGRIELFSTKVVLGKKGGVETL